MNTTMIGILKKVIFYMILIIIWEAVYKVGVDVLGIWKTYTFPEPLNVVKTLISLIKDGTLTTAILISMRRIIVGYVISLVIGLILGF